MNDTTKQDRQPLQTVGLASGVSGASIAPQNLADVVRIAQMMANSDVGVPRHLRGKDGACLRIVMQAVEWEMSPFAVADKSYLVNDKIAYEAQLVAAVINARSGIQGRLRYSFEGEGGSLRCTVTGKLEGEDYSYTSPSLGEIKTKNSPLWASDPQQQIGYFSARSWARRYVPEVLLGVYDRDEAQSMKDVTPEPRPSMASKLGGRVAGEGFSQDHITKEIDKTTTIEAASDQTYNEQDAAPVSSQGDAASDGADATPSPSAPSRPTIEMAKRIVRYIGFLATDAPDGFDDKSAAVESLPQGLEPNTPEPEVRKLKAIKGFAVNVIEAAEKTGDSYTFNDDCTPEWLEAEAANMLGIDVALLRDDAEKAGA